MKVQWRLSLDSPMQNEPELAALCLVVVLPTVALSSVTVLRLGNSAGSLPLSNVLQRRRQLVAASEQEQAQFV